MCKNPGFPKPGFLMERKNRETSRLENPAYIISKHKITLPREFLCFVLKNDYSSLFVYRDRLCMDWMYHKNFFFAK